MLRTTLFNVLLLCSVFAIGCNGTSSTGGKPQGGTATNASSDPPAGSQEELSIPRLDPKPVVWLDKWQAEDPPAERVKSQLMMSIANQLKSAQQYSAAEEAYLQAIDAEPTWAYPPYQLACNYELSDQHDRAVTQFKKAVELGFDDFPTALTDDELGKIREGAEFNATLQTIRQRYIASSKTRVGQPIAVRPGGTQPKEGWPVMLLLHGYGDTNLSYLDHAEQWAELGFLTVAVPGSVPASDGHFQWTMDSTEPTNQDLQAIIKSPLLEGLINRKQVFLLGFSQGALHAMLLTAENPDIYAGVVALSPGGSMADRLATPPLNRSQRAARCMFIHGTREPHAPFVLVWSKACKAAGWKFASKTHPGGHHFPENWDAMRPEIATFLTN